MSSGSMRSWVLAWPTTNWLSHVHLLKEATKQSAVQRLWRGESHSYAMVSTADDRFLWFSYAKADGIYVKGFGIGENYF